MVSPAELRTWICSTERKYWHQEPAMSPAYQIHPDFGYFCPSPGLRRELRVAIVSILFGMVSGAAIVTVGAGHAGERHGVSSNAQQSSRSDTLLPRGNGASSMIAGNAQANPAEAIKPFPMRRVRVPTKASALAGIPHGHTAQPEPSSSADSISHKSEQAALSPAPSPQAQKAKAAFPSAIPATKKRPGAIHARRHRNDQKENARWKSLGERAYAEDHYWRGASRSWVHW
jgi:hypothetical protein